MTPVFKNLVVSDWKYPIVESPKNGQYRYIAFAWKKEGGSKIGIFVRTPDAWHGYGAGEEMSDRMTISTKNPTEWTVVVRDLYKDFGRCDIVGLALSPVDGTAGYYNNIYLGRTEAEVRRVATKR